MPYLMEFLLFLAPFAGFGAWRLLNPGREVSGVVLWLMLAGVACGIGGAVWYGRRASLEAGTTYVPATLGPDGRVQPGHGAAR